MTVFPSFGRGNQSKPPDASGRFLLMPTSFSSALNPAALVAERAGSPRDNGKIFIEQGKIIDAVAAADVFS
jgi:hypothetical protein